jgi:hypothetical protein
MGNIDDYDFDHIRPYKNMCFYLWGFAIIFSILCCLCPDKTDLAIMMGWDALKSDSVQEVIEILKEEVR